MSDIYIVAMPFGSVDWPSLGVGQLIAAAKQDGLDAKAAYPSLKFAETIGYNLYKIIATLLHADHLYGEWLFSRVAFEDSDIPQHTAFLEIFTKDSPSTICISTVFGKAEYFLRNEFKKICGIVEAFVEQTAREILADHPRIVGCSATFMQYNASLALLRKIKQLNPAIVTMLGGANCEAEMGCTTIKIIDWIDFVVSGEADTLFPRLCRQIFTYGVDIPIEELSYGVYSKRKLSATQRTSDQMYPETAIEHNLDDIPIPDYRDYFQDLQETSLRQKLTPALSMETSRGCWKGQKQPCNFCGLNGQKIHYRSKSPKRALQELEDLSCQYGINTFIMTDTILHMGYFKDFLKELSHQQAPYTLFFETTSTLSEHQIKLLTNAGVAKIQPGIESLHDEMLKLLNKGNSAIQNIALLKYALENGLRVAWNLLAGIPGERDSYYQEMAGLLPLLYHLQPPHLAMLRFDRFSQYYQHPRQFGLTLSPLKLYKYVYPFEHDEMTNFAYFFQNNIPPKEDDPNAQNIKKLKRQIDTWNRHFFTENQNNRPHLILSETEHEIVIEDTRPCAVAPEFHLTGIERLIYKECRKPVRRSALYQAICHAHNGNPLEEPAFDQGIRRLVEQKLLLQINGKYLALATFPPKRYAEFPSDNINLFTARFAQEQAPKAQLTVNKTWEWFESLKMA